MLSNSPNPREYFYASAAPIIDLIDV